MVVAKKSIFPLVKTSVDGNSKPRSTMSPCRNGSMRPSNPISIQTRTRTRYRLSEDIINLQAEVNRLKEELRDKTLRLEQADTELFNIDYRHFLDPNPESAKFSKELIDLLKGGGTWPWSFLVRCTRSSLVSPRIEDRVVLNDNQRVVSLFEDGHKLECREPPV